MNLFFVGLLQSAKLVRKATNSANLHSWPDSQCESLVGVGTARTNGSSRAALSPRGPAQPCFSLLGDFTSNHGTIAARVLAGSTHADFSLNYHPRCLPLPIPLLG